MEYQNQKMKTEVKTQIFVLILYLFFTLLHLYPLSLHPLNTVHDTGDPLLNTWILSWVQKSLLSHPGQILDGNIFYPSEKTISYSEHLFPQAVASLPIALIFGNPILTYNILFLLSYVLAAYAMFLLVRHLTQDTPSGFFAGLIFAFSTYHLDHTPQLQLLSSGLFVFSFYFLLRFFQEKRTKYSVLFSVFLMLQALACIYYGLFYISILAVAVPLLLLFYSSDIDKKFLLKLASPILAAGGILLFFSLPYISLMKYSGFSRGLGMGADLVNYLGASKQNILYGKLLFPLGAPERFFFPGFLSFFLMGFYVFQQRKSFHNIHKLIRIFFFIIFTVSLIAIIVILAAGGLDVNLGFLDISANNLLKPTMILFMGILLFIVLSLVLFISSRKRNDFAERRHFYLFLVLFVWALLLSFGKSFSFIGNTAENFSLPFAWLHKFVPGFGGIRAPSRYGVFVLFALAVMAGLGFKAISDRLKKKRTKTIVLCLTLLVLNLEYLSLPQKMRFVPVEKDIPPTYQWLKEQPEDFALIELPFFRALGQESIYLYFSIFHRKKIVNGYSGYLPPSYFYIREVFDSFPSRASMDILKSLKVKYIVFHAKTWNEQRVRTLMERINDEFAEDLEVERVFEYTPRKPWEHSDRYGDDIVFLVHQDQTTKLEPKRLNWQEIPNSTWNIQANINSHRLLYLKDGQLDTRWSTGTAKRSGDYLLLEFQKPMDNVKISIHLGPSVNDYAVDFMIEVSADGEEWEEIEGGYSLPEFLDRLINTPADLVQNVYIQGKDIKYVKLTQIGSSQSSWWSIAELKVLRSL